MGKNKNIKGSSKKTWSELPGESNEETFLSTLEIWEEEGMVFLALSFFLSSDLSV